MTGLRLNLINTSLFETSRLTQCLNRSCFCLGRSYRIGYFGPDISLSLLNIFFCARPIVYGYIVEDLCLRDLGMDNICSPLLFKQTKSRPNQYTLARTSNTGIATIQKTQACLSPGRKSPPIENILATVDNGTNSMVNTVILDKFFAVMLLSCASCIVTY